jgi:hypothetical protein
MLLKPRPGGAYRRTDTKMLIDPMGEQLDPADRNVDRAIRRGDLVPANPPRVTRRPARARAQQE